MYECLASVYLSLHLSHSVPPLGRYLGSATASGAVMVILCIHPCLYCNAISYYWILSRLRVERWTE